MYMIEEDKKREQEKANTPPTPTYLQSAPTGYMPTGVVDTRPEDLGSEGTYNPTGR